MKKEKRVYRPLNFFMLRSPVLPFDVFERLQHKDFHHNLRELARNSLVKESIAIASPSLFNSLGNLVGDDDRKKQQVEMSLMRYLSRMATRSTPFGIMAGMSIGKLADHTEIKLKSSSENQKRTRPDMGWLFAFIHRLEQRPEIVARLKVMRNHLVQHCGRRLTLPFYTEYGQQQNNNGRIRESISIQASKPIIQALDYAKKPVLYTDIVQYLVHLYPNVERSKIKNMIWQLFQQEFLISSLRPPLTNPSPLQHVIDQLVKIPEAKKELDFLYDIQMQIEKYDATPIGQGIEEYLSLTKKMKAIVSSHSQVQVDMRLASEKIKLNRQVGDEVAKAAEILWRLSLPQRGVRHLKKYHRDFLEKYGTRREIPILELLNEETGLGEPNIEEEGSVNDDLSQYIKERELVFQKIIQKSLATRSIEVKLTDELIESLEGKEINEEEAPASMEIYTEIIAPSISAIDRGEYRLVITPTTASQRISQSFGRFMDLLNDDEIEEIKKAVHREQDLYSNVLFVEGNYIPLNSRSANVALNPSMLNYELSLGTNTGKGTSITLDDIYVGATLKRLYLKSRKHNKELIVTSSNMLNYTQAPSIYRFLREVSLENIRTIQAFSWGAQGTSPFLPRIVYGKTVLHPATWNLTLDLLDGLENDQWDHAFQHWREKWMVPRYVYLTYADNRVLLDLEHKEHIKHIQKEIQQGKRVTLKEHVGSLKDRWVKGTDGIYSQECVILVEKSLDRMPRNIDIQQYIPSNIHHNDRVYIPGTEWLFVKLYVSRNSQDDFITQYMWNFAEDMVNIGAAKKWFFMRYADPNPHIRLRFYGVKENLVTKLLPALSQWADPLVSDGVIQKLVLDTYDREIERYGGIHLIHDAEEIFFADSKMVVHLLDMIRYNQIDLLIEEVAALATVDLLECFGLTFKEQLEFLDRIVSKDDFREEFRSRRRSLGLLLDPREDRKALSKIRNGEMIRRLLNTRSPYLISFKKKMQTNMEKELLTNYPNEIIGSLIHMHCNRLMGIDRSKELNAMAFARHTLYSQKYYREKESSNVYEKV